MQDKSKRALRLLDELKSYFEEKDAEELMSKMPKPEVKVEIEAEPVMEGEMAPEMMAEAPMEEELSDEEFEELMRG